MYGGSGVSPYLVRTAGSDERANDGRSSHSLPSSDSTVNDNKEERWDRASVHEFRGTYGDYLLNKVSKVFPELGRKVL